MYQFLKYEKTAALVTLSLNRPEVYNAFNDGLSNELQEAFKLIAKDDEVRVVVLTGEGKGFCSGQDLKSAQIDPQGSYAETVRKRYNPLIKAMRALPKPVIAKVNGVAAGAGCSLLLACDMAIASEQAVLVEAFVGIGLVPDSGSTYFLPRIMGMPKAFELCTMGKKLSAHEALALGMLNKVVAHEALDEAVKEYSNYFEAAPTKTIGLIKNLLNQSQHAGLDEMLEHEARQQELAGATHDHKEGLQAFLEKRKPVYKGY